MATETVERVPQHGLSVNDFSTLRGLLTEILEEHLHGAVPEPAGLDKHPGEVGDIERRWLVILDLCATPEIMRRAVQERSPADESLIVLMKYLLFLGRPVDEDRFDWVLTYIFRRRAEKARTGCLENIGMQIMGMFPGPQPALSPQAQDVLKKMTECMEKIKTFKKFSELTASGLIAKGRELKEQFHEERHHPTILAEVVNYNLVTGKVFHELFQGAALQSQELAKRLAHADYRGNAEYMQKVKESWAPTEDKTRSGQHVVIRGPVQDPVKALGLDDGRESEKVRFALRSLTAYCAIPDNRVQNIVRLSNLELQLTEWEARALSTEYPKEDTSFRAEFARSIRQAVAFIFRIEEERDNLHRKSASEFLWKPHYDALVWVYARGKEYVEEMKLFAETVSKRGLTEKEQQILKSAARLTEALEIASARLTANQ